MRWTTEISGTKEGLLGVWCSGNDAIAVGGSGTILRRRAGTWEREESGTNDNLYAVQGSSEAIVAVGGKLRIGGDTVLLHRGEQGWMAEPSGMQHILLAVTHGRRGWFAAGYNGAILHGEPGRWMRLPLAHFLHVFALCAAGDRVFAAGLAGIVLELGASGDLVRIHDTGTETHLRGLSASSGELVIAVGLGGTITRFDGRRWTQMTSPTGSHLEAVWVEDERSAWAVGSGGTVLRFDGARWDRVSSGTSEHLHAVHGSEEHVIAAGAAGTICRLDRGRPPD